MRDISVKKNKLIFPHMGLFAGLYGIQTSPGAISTGLIPMLVKTHRVTGTYPIDAHFIYKCSCGLLCPVLSPMWPGSYAVRALLHTCWYDCENGFPDVIASICNTCTCWHLKRVLWRTGHAHVMWPGGLCVTNPCGMKSYISSGEPNVYT